MDNTPLISVIVPVYKVEAYLDKCISSIVGQTYKNLEIILVDDGSPDKCPQMCDAWAAKDSRIRVIHKENGGLSDARNVGMAVAKGELIGFVDSDDWIEDNMYKLLYQHIVNEHSDISACGVEVCWDDGTPSRMLTKTGCCVLDREEAMRAIIEESWLKQPVWYKLYKTELIRDILFPVGKYHEDVFWSYQAVARAERVAVFDALCYHYRQRSGSIMGDGYSLKRLDSLEAKCLQLSFVRRSFPSLEGMARLNILFSCIYAMQMCLKYLPETDIESGRREILKALDLGKPYQEITDVSLKQRVWILLSGLSFDNTCRLRNLFKIGV